MARVFQEVSKSFDRLADQNGDQVVTLTLPAQSGKANVENWLAQVRPTVVITIGRAAYESVNGLDKKYAIVAGMVDVPAQDRPPISAVTLLPEPRTMFSTIQALSPKTRRVFVAFDPTRHNWLIEIAKRQARESNLELIVLPSPDLRSAAVNFSNIFRFANPQTDALWIIDNQLATEDTTLPTIVEESWLHDFPVCSNAIQLLTRGVLCTAYVAPDTVGERLFALAKERIEGRPARVVMPTTAKRGVNRRVASHLGIDLDASQRKEFDMIVGE